jgi:hypothetical protein
MLLFRRIETPPTMKRFSDSDYNLRAPRHRVRGRFPRIWYRVTTTVAVSVFLISSIVSAQQAKPKEYEVKATYLYNFGRFVQWPANVAASTGDSFPICVIGQDPIGPALNTIVSGESIVGKPVVVKQISKPQDALGCRVLYISLSEETRLKEILAALNKATVLTVSDISQFSQRGGMIQFVLDGNKVRFEVNVTSAADAGLTLSSELLKVAVTVRKNPQPGD